MIERQKKRSILRSCRVNPLTAVIMAPAKSVFKDCLRWTPPGRRKQERLRTSWRRTVMAELKQMGLTWGEAHVAKDRSCWTRIVDALCLTRDEKD